MLALDFSFGYEVSVMEFHSTFHYRLSRSHWVSALVLGLTCTSFPIWASEANLRVELNTGRVIAFCVDKELKILWIGSENGLFRKDPGQPDPVPTNLPPIGSYAFYEDKVNRILWIGSEKGLFRKDPDQPDPVPTNLQTGWVYAFNQDQKGILWIGSEKGLFRKDPGQCNPVSTNLPIGWVNQIYKDQNGTIWIVAEKGLFRKDPGKTDPVPTNLPAGRAYSFYEDQKGFLWIAPEKGLFRKDPEKADPVPTSLPTGRAHPFYEDQKGFLWIGGEKSLFRKDPGKTDPVATNLQTGLVYSFYEDRKGFVWIAAEKGLFRKDPGKIDPVPTNLPTGWAYSFYEDQKGFLWITTEKGLFRKDPGKTDPVPTNLQSDYALPFYEDKKGILWIGWTKGLYRKDPGKTDPIPINLPTGTVFQFYEDQKGNLWIGAEKGLFRLASSNGEWKAKIEVGSGLPEVILRDNYIKIAWNISNYEWRATPDTVLCRVAFYEESGKENEVARFEVPRSQFEFTFDPQKHTPFQPGKYHFQIEAEDLRGNVAKSATYPFTVNASYMEVVVGWLKRIGGWSAVVYGTLNVLAFVGLVVGARWSRRCFEILTDPVVRKFGIYFGFALRHIRFVRLWVFERYYQQVKADLRTDHEYVDRPVLRVDGSEFPTSQMLDELKAHSHVWLSGKPGTGKSEMVKMLMRTYFAEPSLRTAWKRFRFIPIGVPLRRVPGKTVVEIVMEALRQQELPFDDDKYFKRLFPSADFLVLLDGFNEVALDELAVLAVPPSVRLLITSQTRPQQAQDKFELLELSPVTPEFAKQLLIVFLGEERSQQTGEKIAKSLWEEIESAYDVKLIADLFNAGRKLPSNVSKLYEAIFDYAASLHSEDYPKQIVCEFAWNCWKAGKRRFKPDEKLTTDLLKPLEAASIVVLRGTDFEFRHDLMRGYLAACWALKHAASLPVTVERLQEKEIWNLSPSDQASVFPFLTRLVETKDDLRMIAEFAAQEPGVRVRLLEAARTAVRKKRWGNLEITLAVPDDVEKEVQEETAAAGPANGA
jgi:hypothetical protein